jgi:hypothetical protein
VRHPDHSTRVADQSPTVSRDKVMHPDYLARHTVPSCLLTALCFVCHRNKY